MAETLGVPGFDSAQMMLIDDANQGVMELDATEWFLNVYDNMKCEPGREVAKATLKNRLGFYSHLLDVEAGLAAKQLALVNRPATAQAGQRIKDDLRAAKNKLDEIANVIELTFLNLWRVWTLATAAKAGGAVTLTPSPLLRLTRCFNRPPCEAEAAFHLASRLSAWFILVDVWL